MYQIGRSISIPALSSGRYPLLTGHPCRRYGRRALFLFPSERGEDNPVLAKPSRSPAQRITPKAVVSPNLVFDAVTVGVMPLYALMMWFPRARLTKKLMGSNLFLFVGGSILYAYMLVSYGGYEIFKPIVEAIQSHGLSSECSGRYLAIMADMLRDTKVTALTWVHLLLMDLFQAKWVYEDALRHNVYCIHSLVLCFMVGPLGLLSHVLTKTLKQTNA